MRVVIEMDGYEYDTLKEESEMGRKCLKAIKSLEHSNDTKSSHHIVEVRDKKYEISIVRWKGIEI